MAPQLRTEMARRVLTSFFLLALTITACSDSTGPKVPQGTIIAQGPDGLFLIEADGSNLRSLRTLIGADDMAPQWNPAGTEAVYHARFASSILQVIGLDGQSRAQNPGIPGISEQVWAEYTADGSWIYFQAWSNTAFKYQIWRIRPNGTGAERVSAASETRSAEAPSPSPNGQEVAYTLRHGAMIPFEVIIQNLATGVTRSLGAGFGVRWSPDGNSLAFVDGTALTIAAVNGSRRRVLNPLVPYRTGLDWSSDSDWVVARQDIEGGSIDLVRIDGGEVVPIPNTQFLRQPSLR